MAADDQDLLPFPSAEELAKMASKQDPLDSAGRKPEDVFAIEDDTEVFTRGFCHAMAVEIHRAFTEAGQSAEFIYLASSVHEHIASHVLVKSGDAYYDAHFGPQTEREVLGRWSASSDGRLRPVRHHGWLTDPAEAPEGITPSHTFLGFRIEPTYFAPARERAARFISRNRSRFGLPGGAAP